MKNNFLDKNERIKEAICTFRAEPSGDTYKVIFQQIEQERVVCFNYCTFGYSMRSWQWEQWEKKLQREEQSNDKEQ